MQTHSLETIGRKIQEIAVLYLSQRCQIGHIQHILPCLCLNFGSKIFEGGFLSPIHQNSQRLVPCLKKQLTVAVSWNGLQRS